MEHQTVGSGVDYLRYRIIYIEMVTSVYRLVYTYPE